MNGVKYKELRLQHSVYGEMPFFISPRSPITSTSMAVASRPVLEKTPFSLKSIRGGNLHDLTDGIWLFWFGMVLSHVNSCWIIWCRSQTFFSGNYIVSSSYLLLMLYSHIHIHNTNINGNIVNNNDDFNERTNTLLNKNIISHSLFSKGWCWLCVRDELEMGTDSYFDPKFFFRPLQHFFLILAWLLNRGSLRAQSPLSAAGSQFGILSPTDPSHLGHLVIL